MRLVVCRQLARGDSRSPGFSDVTVSCMKNGGIEKDWQVGFVVKMRIGFMALKISRINRQLSDLYNYLRMQK